MEFSEGVIGSSLLPSANAFVVAKFAFPFTNYLFNRRRVMSHYRMLCRTERLPPSVARRIQLRKLKEVLAYASTNVPYYQALFRRIGLEVSDINRLEDLRYIPSLSREDVIEHRKEMVDRRFAVSVGVADRSGRPPGEPISFAPFRRHRLLRNTSSGSTGAPTVFYEDGSRAAMNWAYEVRMKNWYGIYLGEREARLTRFSTPANPRRVSHALRTLLWNQLILPGANLSEGDYAQSVEGIIRFRPASLWGYTSALTGLADYVRRHSIDLSRLQIRLLIAWAAPLHGPEKALLESVFGCPAASIYSAREVGHIAATCPADSLHVNQDNLIVEANDTSHSEKAVGELLVTNLDVTPMPFIRYRTGDIGRLGGSVCSCGRTLTVLDDLIGRKGEIFVTKDGRMISPNFWCRVFMSDSHVGSIRRFQVVYTAKGKIRLLIVRGPGYSEETERSLRKVISDALPIETGLEIQLVPDIFPHVSGKYQMVVRERL